MNPEFENDSKASSKDVEYRRSVRRRVHVEVLLWSSQARSTGEIVDMSETGCRMNLAAPASDCSELHLSFSLPYTEVTLRCDARVVWNERTTVGVEFLRMRDADKSLLGRWLETHAA